MKRYVPGLVTELTRDSANDTDADKMCSNFIRDVKLFPQENRGLIDEIYYLCTC